MTHPNDLADQTAELAVALGSELERLPSSMRETIIDTAERLARTLTPEDVTRLASVLAVQNAFRYAEGVDNGERLIARLAAGAPQQTTTVDGLERGACPDEETYLVPRKRPDGCRVEGRHGRHLVESAVGLVGCPGALR